MKYCAQQPLKSNASDRASVNLSSVLQFWQHGSHPIELYTEEVIWQKIRYLHNNPVKAGIVTEPEHYLHCSAHPDRELKIADLW